MTSAGHSPLSHCTRWFGSEIRFFEVAPVTPFPALLGVCSAGTLPVSNKPTILAARIILPPDDLATSGLERSLQNLNEKSVCGHGEVFKSTYPAEQANNATPRGEKETHWFFFVAKFMWSGNTETL